MLHLKKPNLSSSKTRRRSHRLLSLPRCRHSLPGLGEWSGLGLGGAWRAAEAALGTSTRWNCSRQDVLSFAFAGMFAKMEGAMKNEP